MARKSLITVCNFGGAICLFSIVANLAYNFHLGGSASPGDNQNGHYYVRDHGNRREVSRDQFERSIFLECTTLVTLPFAVVGGVMAFIEQQKKKRNNHAA
jgi:hypothetical protein